MEETHTSETTATTEELPGAVVPAVRPVPGLSGLTPDLPSWTAQDYASHITGSGADKLADSGVAPLIAAARGYKLLNADNFVEEMKTMQVSLRTGQGQRFKKTLKTAGKDGMQMPWYSIADIHKSARDGGIVEPFTYQVRPSHPELNDHGKSIKYEFVANVGTPLDIHPSTPAGWIDTTPVVMFAEGMLKGDSALSAYLYSNGVSWEDLRSEGVADPVERLRTVLDGIPEADRVLIISIAGINNAHQNPIDWREIRLKDREGWIAFDADLAVNPHVHSAARKLHTQLDDKCRMSTIKFLSPEIVRGDGGESSKEGVDDFLAKTGTWGDLLGFLTETMPPAPTRDPDEKHGNWRVSKDGLSAEECSAISNGPGGTIGGYVWEERVDLGGRILALEARRQPTDQELRNGIFDDHAPVGDPEDSLVEIEVAWAAGGREQKAVVSGPENILNYTPADWVRHGATIPRDLLRHPSWPPRGAKGESWLSAVKANRSDETVVKTRWMQMGWVPQENGDPVFLVGEQVIGDLDGGSVAAAGVDDDMLPVASNFGVGTKLEGDFEDELYRKMVRRDFQDVFDAYITSRAWTDMSTAALILAAGLRPAIPLRPRSTIFLWGPKGRGKSWSAKCMMYFWARHRSDWQDQLPGSAKDTVAYIEYCVARTPIWVVDDLAPSAVRKQAESEQAKLADLTRSIFNNATKGRMNADMTARKVHKPIAQLVITAENELTTPSAKERLIPAYIGQGKLNKDREPTDRINRMAAEDGTQARLTSHLLRYIRQSALESPGGWGAYMVRLEEMRALARKRAEMMMREEMGASTGSLERTSQLAADVLLTLNILGLMAADLDMDEDFVDQFGADGIGKHIVSMINDAHAENQRFTPGRSLITSLSSLLASGKAHVINGDDPARPPIVGTDEGESLANHRLGWVAGNTDGTLKPSGVNIGTLAQKGGRQIILFQTSTAFNEAQRAYPELIQHGQGAAAAWSSIWDEDLAPEGMKRARNSRGTLLNSAQIRVGKSTVSGVPISVDTILNVDPSDREQDDEAPAAD